MKIGLTFDLRDQYLAEGWSEQDVAEFDRADTIDALEQALVALGHRVERVGHVDHLIRALHDGRRWDLVWNLAEGRRGVGRESLIPALLDDREIPYTFSDPLTCAVTLDKPTCKRILRDHGLPTPEFQVVERASDLVSPPGLGPWFAKPAREGSSKGIETRCRVDDPASLRGLCAELLERFRQPVIVEPFLPGREVTVGIVGSGTAARAVAVLEVSLRSQAFRGVYGYETKERCEELVDYKLADDDFGRAAADLAVAAHRALGCRDASRVDIRADRDGRPSILELNPLPGMHPQHSDLPIMTSLAGWTFEELVGAIVESAQARVRSIEPPRELEPCAS